MSSLGHDVGESDQSPTPATEVEWVNTELHTIASTIEELQGRLNEANTRLASASKVETTEFEIGRLFVEAQRFSEASLSKLELTIHEILGEAEAKANRSLQRPPRRLTTSADRRKKQRLHRRGPLASCRQPSLASQR